MSSFNASGCHVLIVGVGGLGSPAALALAAAGGIELTLVDDDVVELSNLHRQPLYHLADIGLPKAAAAAARLIQRFPDLRVRPERLRVTADNAAEVFRTVDFVIDGTDRMSSKYALNDAAVRAGKPLSHAGVVGWTGQALTILPGRSACLRCLFPEVPGDDEAPTCQEAGVIGGLVACFGALQAAEAIKYARGLHTGLLTDRLLTCDALAQRWREIKLARRDDCPLCGAETPAASAGSRSAAGPA